MMKKKIEKWCREYAVNVVIYAVLFTIGGLVKDSAVMKGAASVSTLLAAAMTTFIMWRRKDKSANDLIYEEYSRMYYAEFKRQISRDVAVLKNEALDRGYEIEIPKECTEEDAYAFLRTLPVFRACLDEAVETWDKDEEESFISTFKSLDVMITIEVRRLTEEEKMQRKLLKEMGIEK